MNAPTTAKANRRVGEVLLMTAAIVLVLVGGLRMDWFSGGAGSGDAQFHVGLRQLAMCSGSNCTTLDFDQTNFEAAFRMSGNVTYFGAIIASVLGVLTALLVLIGVPFEGPISPGRLAVAFFAATAVAGVVFLLSAPSDMVPTGASGPEAIAGCVLGVIAAVMLMRPIVVPPTQLPRAFATAGAVSPARPTSMSPACPACMAPTELNQQHQRWFCSSCRAYV